MVESSNQDPFAEDKRAIRSLMKKFHEDTSSAKGKDVQTLREILAQCNDAVKAKNLGAWPKGFTYSDAFVTLVRFKDDGEVERSERSIRVAGTPKEFLSTFQAYVDRNELPSEKPQDREDREAADAAAYRQQSSRYRNDPFTSATEQAERERREREATERARSEARQRAEREARERAEKERYEKEQQAKQEAERREREAREAAGREARKPENAFARRFENATTLEHFKAIVKDMDEMFENQPPGRPDAEFPQAEMVFPQEAYTRLRFDIIPKRARELYEKEIENAATIDALRSIFIQAAADEIFTGEEVVNSELKLGKDGEAVLSAIYERAAPMYRAEIANAADVNELRSVFTQIVKDDFFRHAEHDEILSRQGELLLLNVFEHAGSIFRDKIQRAQYRSELADIEHEMEQFFGGRLQEAQAFDPSRKTPLNAAERSTMTREQIKRHQRGETEPLFSGPLSAVEGATLARDARLASFGPSGYKIAEIVAELSALLEKKKESMWRSRLPRARRA